eukprot:scaffold165445_cov18-Prasinocladus_malaysianus.AAC.1
MARIEMRPRCDAMRCDGMGCEGIRFKERRGEEMERRLALAFGCHVITIYGRLSVIVSIVNVNVYL